MNEEKYHVNSKDLSLAEQIANTLSVVLENLKLNISKGESYRREIEWELSEAELYSRAKQLLQNEQDITGHGTHLAPSGDLLSEYVAINNKLKELIAKTKTYIDALEKILIGVETPKDEVQRIKDLLRASKEIYSDLVKKSKMDEVSFANIEQTAIESFDTLKLSISLPPSILVNEYVQQTSNILLALDSIYTMFATLLSSKPNAVENLLENIRKSSSGKNVNVQIEPLRIISMHYGSPFSLDILGVGKAIELIRDIVKDLVWRGKSEKAQAESDRAMAKLQAQKTKVEIATKKKELEKIKLENEKLALEVAEQKLELIIKTAKLQISDADKNLLAKALIPQMGVIIQHSPTLLQSGGTDYPLVLSNNIQE